MTSWQDTDLSRSASHRAMVSHLCGPFLAGAVDTWVPIGGTGRVQIGWNSREALLLVGPLAPLGSKGLRLRAILDPDGAAQSLSLLEFAPFSEQGAFLPLHRPEVDPDTHTAKPFTIALSLAEVGEDGNEQPVPAGVISDRVVATLLEGILGRMIYLLGAEKQRLRRQGREIASMRFLQSARDDALDRYGAELAVPRFSDQIQYDPNAKQVVTVIRKDATGAIRPEPDPEYRRRLSLYRPVIVLNRKQLLGWLNGPGKDNDDNRGFFAQFGFKPRFNVVEDTNPFAVAIHLVGAGNPQLRTNFLNLVRGAFLIWPANSPAANKIHLERYLPSRQRQQIQTLRGSLRMSFEFASDAAIASMLAAALDRVGGCRRTLNDKSLWPVLRAQDGAAGSRYELGLGVDVPPLPPATLDQLGAALLAPNRKPAADPEIEALLQAMKFTPSAQDPEARWLLEPCGLRTIHRVNTGTIYLSHLPTFGLVVSGPSDAPAAGALVNLEARYHAPGDPGSHAVLVAGLNGAAKEWGVAGGPAWTALTDPDARARWDQARAPQPASALDVFGAAGLPANASLGPIVAQLKQLPPELLQTLRLAPAQVQRILAGQPAAADELRRLVTLFQKQSLNSVLPMVTGPAAGPNDVLLVVGVVGLPGAGINLSERRSTGFRWYVVRLERAGGFIRAIGSRTQFVPVSVGLSAIVVIGYARRGLVDPYEYRIELPDGAVLDLAEYEFLMNLLDRTYPTGIEVNTYSIRQQHVDLEGKGKPTSLSPSVSRTYRKFRRLRQRGEVGVTLE